MQFALLQQTQLEQEKKIKGEYARKDKQDFVETRLQNDKTFLAMH